VIALVTKNENFLINEARRQVEAGAQFVDLNVSALLEKEAEALHWAIPLLQQNLDIFLAIDTLNPQAMKVGLEVHHGQAILNSITAEKSRLEAMLPLVKDYSPLVIALSDKLLEIFQKNGVPEQNIFLDPLVRPLGVNPEAGKIFLRSLELIKKNFPQVKTVAGISNVSFGLPWRALLNRTLLLLARGKGLDAAICNPLDKKLTAQLRATEALLGLDPQLTNYLGFYRQQKK